MNPDGGIVTLPRLYLSYYALIATGVAALCGLIMLIFRRNKYVFNITLKIFFLPVCYLFGHFAIKGFTSSSYTAVRDFFAILLITIPLYIAFLIAVNLINMRKYS